MAMRVIAIATSAYRLPELLVFTDPRIIHGLIVIRILRFFDPFLETTYAISIAQALHRFDYSYG